MLVLHGVVMLVLHCILLWYRAPARLPALPLSAQSLALLARVRQNHTASEEGPAKRRTCARRLALYFAPRGTIPRLEDFDFLVNALRVWKATHREAALVVFADGEAAPHKPLTRACRALLDCLQRRVPPELLFNASVARLVDAALKSLALVSAAPCVPNAGVVLYAPAPGQLGASIDSRSLFEHNARNTTRCIDAHHDAHRHACMGFTWS
jgi:hypothetical protein